MYVGDTIQRLHCKINDHRCNIMHGKTEESPVAEDLNCEGYTFADVIVVAIDKINSHTGKQVDQDPG